MSSKSTDMKLINLEDMIADVESNMDYVCCNCNEFVEDHWLLKHEDYVGQLLVCCPVSPVDMNKRFRPVLNTNFEELGRRLKLVYSGTGESGHDIARISQPHGVKINK